MTYRGNSIIDYFISTSELTSPQLITRDDLSLNSYHMFITQQDTLKTLILTYVMLSIKL
jgi:hypothetical protein